MKQIEVTSSDGLIYALPDTQEVRRGLKIKRGLRGWHTALPAFTIEAWLAEHRVGVEILGVTPKIKQAAMKYAKQGKYHQLLRLARRIAIDPWVATDIKIAIHNALDTAIQLYGGRLNVGVIHEIEAIKLLIN